MRFTAINWLKFKSASFSCITIFILYLGYASSWVTNDIFTSFVFLFLTILFFKKGRKFDPVIYYITIVWFAINILSAFVINTNQEFSFITLTGVTMRIIMPYFIVKIIGTQFMGKLIRYAYVLSIFGLILFSIQLVIPRLFYALSPYLNFMTQDEQVEGGGWYIFIYMFSSWGNTRNCGFAWEPGAYSCILVYLLAFQLVNEKFKIDKYSTVFTISLLTTLSTSGYLALFLVIISFFLYKKKLHVNPLYLIGIMAFFVFSFNFYQTSEFMKKKIDMYYEQKDLEYTHFTGLERINRVEEFNRGVEQSFHWPFGNGVLGSDFRIRKHGYAVGPNSLSLILMQWGWVGMGFFLFSTAGCFYFLSRNNIVSGLLTLAICMVLYSNPFTMRYLVFVVFFYYYIFIKKSVIKFDSNTDLDLQQKAEFPLLKVETSSH